MTWIGRKKIAFIPVFRPNARPPDMIPADWHGDILRRVLFDPDPATGADKSLRACIHAASSGRADLDAVVMPMATIDLQDVRLDILDEQLDGPGLRDQGFDAVAIVMLGGPGAGTAQPGGFWSRFVMRECVGVWAMELMHVLTAFADLYVFNGNMGDFDMMACCDAAYVVCKCGTHPSAYTKAAVGWLDVSAIASHPGRAAGYDLHSRRKVKAVLQQVPDAEIFPHLRELSDPWSMGKDGKVRFDPTRYPKDMRK